MEWNKDKIINTNNYDFHHIKLDVDADCENSNLKVKNNQILMVLELIMFYKRDELN